MAVGRQQFARLCLLQQAALVWSPPGETSAEVFVRTGHLAAEEPDKPAPYDQSALKQILKRGGWNGETGH